MRYYMLLYHKKWQKYESMIVAGGHFGFCKLYKMLNLPQIAPSGFLK